MAVTPQEALVRAEAVNVVMFLLARNTHLLSAESSPGTRPGHGCKELARVGAGGRAALETSPAPGCKSTPRVSVAELSLQNTWSGLCSPITANLFPFEKYPGALYSLFADLFSSEKYLGTLYRLFGL